jgi:hypothetical protein
MTGCFHSAPKLFFILRNRAGEVYSFLIPAVFEKIGVAGTTMIGLIGMGRILLQKESAGRSDP